MSYRRRVSLCLVAGLLCNGQLCHGGQSQSEPKSKSQKFIEDAQIVTITNLDDLGIALLLRSWQRFIFLHRFGIVFSIPYQTSGSLEKYGGLKPLMRL